MKIKLTKKEAYKKVDDLFKQGNFKPWQVKKIKRLAMKYNLKLGDRKKKFCEKCFSDLEKGKVRIKKQFKTAECLKCGHKNRWKIKLS